MNTKIKCNCKKGKCNCKTKKRGGGSDSSDSSDSSYVFISDLEGTIPVSLVNRLCNTSNDGDKFHKLLSQSNNNIIVFTGDLIDRGSESIRLMSCFKKLAEENKAILIAGNRDLNKLRLASELFDSRIAIILLNNNLTFDNICNGIETITLHMLSKVKYAMELKQLLLIFQTNL